MEKAAGRALWWPLSPLLTHRARAESGDTALHSLVPGLDMLYTLLKLAGADVAARNSAGETALHCAVARGDLNLTRMLLLDACDVNAQRGDGRTPAHLAAAHADAETRLALVRSLVKSNASLALADAAGELPVDVARRAPEPAAVVVRHFHNLEGFSVCFCFFFFFVFVQERESTRGAGVLGEAGAGAVAHRGAQRRDAADIAGVCPHERRLRRRRRAPQGRGRRHAAAQGRGRGGGDDVGQIADKRRQVERGGAAPL